MARTQELEHRLSIVVVGTFNPSIFQPSWFAQEELVRRAEADVAKLEIIHTEVTVFETEWFRLEATRDRLIVRSARESHFEALRDLVVGTLDLLRHTPTGVLGVNHDIVIQCPSREAFDQLGWTLAPRDNWLPVLERPGVARLHEMGQRTDGFEGYVQVIVEPILDGGTKIRLEVNDHFDFSHCGPHSSTEQIRCLLEDAWGTISLRADDILNHMRDMVK